MKYSLSILLAVCACTGLFAQEDTMQVSILPYYEPLHSDRPGATNDARSVKQAMVLQFGVGYSYLNPALDELNASSGVSAGGMLRMPTCIGEFDVTAGVSRSTGQYLLRGSAYSSYYNFTDIANSVGVGYRPEWYTTESFALGSIFHLGYTRTLDKYAYTTISDIDSLNMMGTEERFNTHYITPNFSLNASYDINNHWSISSTLGIVSAFAIGQAPGPESDVAGMTTLNVGYGLQRWSLFLEGVARFHNAGPDYSVNGGFTYSISRDFQLDAFFRTRDWGQYDVVGSQPVSIGILTGFTYVLR